MTKAEIVADIAAKTGIENILVEAVAGAGKTTTLIECVKHIIKFHGSDKRILLLAHNKSTRDTLKEKIETLEDAIDTYDETRETVQDLMQELEELAGMPPLPVITSDLIDIYKEVNDELDDIEEKLDKINGESERLTGANKVKKLKEAAAVEKEKLKTLEKKRKVLRTIILVQMQGESLLDLAAVEVEAQNLKKPHLQRN